PASLTYLEALDFLSRQGRVAMKLGTERTRAMLDLIGAPDRSMRGALIAGTNGKGSTGACLSTILRAAGHHVGFMPKPHLISYTERIEVDGRAISEGDFARTLEELIPTFDAIAAEKGPATEFEMLTAMAIAYLAPRTDVLVCEVGLGGRLDATNALDLGVAVITNVDLDHQKYLGNTIAEIAREKVAIIKEGDVALTGCEGEALAIVEDRVAGPGAGDQREAAGHPRRRPQPRGHGEGGCHLARSHRLAAIGGGVRDAERARPGPGPGRPPYHEARRGRVHRGRERARPRGRAGGIGRDLRRRLGDHASGRRRGRAGPRARRALRQRPGLRVALPGRRDPLSHGADLRKRAQR